MKASHTAMSYYKEKTCAEEIVAIAHDIARGMPTAVALNVGNKAYQQDIKKHKAHHLRS